MKKNFYKDLDEYLVKSLHPETNFDVMRREVGIGTAKSMFYALNSLSDGELIAELLQSVNQCKQQKSLLNQLFLGNVVSCNNFETIFVAICSGQAVLVNEKLDYAFIIELRKYPNRAIDEPDSEKAIRGSKDGFNENIQMNIGLIRRRIRSNNLIVNLRKIGKVSKTDIAVVYMENVVDKRILNDLMNRINKINIDSLIMTDKALEQLLFKQEKHLFPLVRYTERPDVTAMNVVQGRIAIVVDNSSSVIIVPTTFFSHTTNVQEFRTNRFIGSFTRILRMAAILVSVYILPLWMALFIDFGNSSPFHLIPSGDCLFSIPLQALLCSLLIEILSLAIIHTPNQINSSIGLIAAIVLGDISVKLKIFYPEILLLVSFAKICSFATPSYELGEANKIASFILIILSAMFGRVGLLFGTIILFLILVNTKTMKEPYLYPLIPFEGNVIKNIFIRKDSDKNTLL